MRSSGAPVSCAAGCPRRSAPRRPLNANVRRHWNRPMRSELLEPVRDLAKLRQLLPIAAEVFRLHEAGRSYSKQLKEISRLTGQIVGEHAVLAAFGSGN